LLKYISREMKQTLFKNIIGYLLILPFILVAQEAPLDIPQTGRSISEWKGPVLLASNVAQPYSTSEDELPHGTYTLKMKSKNGALSTHTLNVEKNADYHSLLFKLEDSEAPGEGSFSLKSFPVVDSETGEEDEREWRYVVYYYNEEESLYLFDFGFQSKNYEILFFAVIYENNGSPIYQGHYRINKIYYTQEEGEFGSYPVAHVSEENPLVEVGSFAIVPQENKTSMTDALLEFNNTPSPAAERTEVTKEYLSKRTWRIDSADLKDRLGNLVSSMEVEERPRFYFKMDGSFKLKTKNSVTGRYEEETDGHYRITNNVLTVSISEEGVAEYVSDFLILSANDDNMSMSPVVEISETGHQFQYSLHLTNINMW
jgi:hypothetical protein